METILALTVVFFGAILFSVVLALIGRIIWGTCLALIGSTGIFALRLTLTGVVSELQARGRHETWLTDFTTRSAWTLPLSGTLIVLFAGFLIYQTRKL